MFGYVAATLLFASCLGQVPHKSVDRGHGAGFSFNDFENFGGFGGDIVQPASFARSKEFGRSAFESPKNVGGFRDFGIGSSHGGLSAIAKDTKGLVRTADNGIAPFARPKIIGDSKFNVPKDEIGQAFAYVSQSFGSPSDFKEIPVHDKAFADGVTLDNSKLFRPELGHDGHSVSGTAAFRKGSDTGGGVAHDRFFPSEGIKSFGGPLYVGNGVEYRPSQKLGFISVTENGGRGSFDGGPIHNSERFEGVDVNRQFFSPGKFDGLDEGTQKGPKFIGTNNFGSEISNDGHKNFESIAKHGGLPFSDPRFGNTPLYGGPSFATPIRFEGVPGQDDITFSNHRQLGGQPIHGESAFNRNVGFGSGPTHGGHNRFDGHKENGKNGIQGGPPIGVNLGLKESLSHGVHSIGEHEGLSRRPTVGVPPLDDSSIHKLSTIGNNENKFGLIASPFDRFQNLDGVHINRGLVGHHGHLPNSFIGEKEVPGKNEVRSNSRRVNGFDGSGARSNGLGGFNGNRFDGHSFNGHGFGGNGFVGNGFVGNGFVGNGFGGNGFGGNGFGGNGFGGHSFGGHGFGGHGLGGNALGGSDFDRNRFVGGGFNNNGFVGNINHGSPVSFENAEQNHLKKLNIGLDVSKDGSRFDGSKESVGRPIYGQHQLPNPFELPLRQSSSLANVEKAHDRFNGFGLGFVQRSPFLNGPNKFHEGLAGIDSLHREQSVHSPLNHAKESKKIGVFQRGPFFEGSLPKDFSEFNENPAHISSLGSNRANKAINVPSRISHPQHREFSDTNQKGLGTEIIHIGSFDSIGLGKRGPMGLGGRLNSHGPSSDEIAVPGNFEKGLTNSGQIFGTHKRFQSEVTNIGGPTNMHRGVTHKRSHGFGHPPSHGRTHIDQTKTFSQHPINKGTKAINDGSSSTKSLLAEPKIFGVNQAFRESTSMGVITGGSKRVKQVSGSEGKTVLIKDPAVERVNFQHKEPVKSGPLYISHREYANEGPKGIVNEKVNVPAKPLRDASPSGKLIARNPKESSRGRVANSG